MRVSLERLGWSPAFAERFEPFARQGLVPGRVAVSHNHLYRVLTSEGERGAELSGRLRHAARSAADLPVTGDWVALASGPSAERDSVRGLVPRRSAFVRAAAGGGGDQVLAANVDTALLLGGLDHDFSPRRLERYLALAWEGGADPVIVLTKADLCDDLEERLRRVEPVAMGVPVHVVSAVTGAGVAALEPLLAPGRTLALLGSSGVGKSTLVNRLLGAERQETAAVRESDSRGRHTTTRREMVPLPGGALLIDTPGLREVGMAGGSSGDTPAGFDDVAALALECGFRDCAHEAEPRCAVREAVETGRLPEERWQSWRQLRRELQYAERRHDHRLQLEEQRRWKIIHKAVRRHKPHR